MSLSAKVIARFSTTRLLQWTNPDNSAATSNDTTRLDAACTDAVAELEVVCGVEYDDDDERHAQAAIWGVRAYLLSYMDQGAAKEARAQYTTALRQLAKVTGRDRVMPSTNSQLQPTPVPRTPGGIARPDFDDRVFDGAMVKPPGSTGNSPDWSDPDEDG